MQECKIKYPLKFRPIFKKTMWGSECWAVSAIKGFESVVDGGVLNGRSLIEIMDFYGEALLGRKNVGRFGKEFPLLVKFIDAVSDLSVQVHPNDILSMERHGCNGKTEMWYVVDAKSDAKLLSGFASPVTEEEYKSMSAKQIVGSLMEYKISNGDMFYLPAGTVHSIGAGAFIAEIQQSSDITYRIYDFDRKDRKGNPRELHTELAADAIDFSKRSRCKIDYQEMESDSVDVWDHAFKAVDCDHFVTSLVDLNGRASDTETRFIFEYSKLDSFVIITCVGGNAIIGYDGVESGDCEDYMDIASGDAVLLPADLGSVTFTVKAGSCCKFLETHI